MTKQLRPPVVVARITLTALLFIVVSTVSAQIIYDNGGLATGANTASGVAAPAGNQWSEAQANYGDTTSSNTTAGSSCFSASFRIADDFIVPAGQTWTINGVVTYAYLTGGATAPPSPFTSGVLQIWSGRPGDAGSAVVFGDTTTNRLTSSTDSTLYRVFNTTTPAPGTAPGTTRRIWQNVLSVSPSLVLGPGHYWVDWGTTVNNTAATTHFCPGNTYPGTRGTPLMNARQITVATGVWTDVLDVGNPATAPDYLQDFPFKLTGTISGAPTAPLSRTLDFDGDNRADFTIARSADATSATSWWVQTATGAVSVTSLGTGVGFASADKAAPADYDGDGKTDIAVWRPGAPTTARFLILQSSTNTLRTELFGQTGDDSSVVADFDGDGKADPAVYRAGSTGFFYFRGSLNNPSGNVTFVPWGTTGDLALPGDFDGDRKADFAIYRNNGGLAEHWQRLSNGSVRAFQYGLTSDKMVSGDFDSDGKTDLVAVRANGSNFDWYILRSSNGVLVVDTFGNPATDFIVPGDYDGDNRSDIAVWRSGTGAGAGNYFVRNSITSPVIVRFGLSGGSLTSPDYPVANFSVK